MNTYTNEFEYNVTGKILRKNQQNTGLIADTNITETIAETTYDWTYEYTGAHPNAVTKAGTRTMAYDLNGNMTSMTVGPLTPGGGSYVRTLTWNEENRLKQTTDASGTNSIVTTYEYDAAGTRVLKKGKYGTVQYVSDNYTVRNKDLISKHVFAGNTRLVSRVVMNEQKDGKTVATEQGAYYYHADHLGSSSVVTDGSGKFYEQIEYFPYGETWVHNKASTTQVSTPYKFTSKELDEETGLYYYGARYYDAKLSRWISADPILANYLSGKPSGGIFNSINLNLYNYGADNPIKFIDPNGKNTVVLKSTEGANGAGHSAALVQTGESEWTYYSRNGQNKGSHSGDLGKDPGRPKFKSPEDFFQKQANSVKERQILEHRIRSGKEKLSDDVKTKLDNLKEFTHFDEKTGLAKARYDAGLELRTTSSQDKKIENFLKEHQNDTYYLVGNNCKDLISDALNAGGYKNYNHSLLAPNVWYQFLNKTAGGTKEQQLFSDSYDGWGH